MANCNTFRDLLGLKNKAAFWLMVALLAGFLPQQTLAQRNYADNSVLASGSWYKIAITETGIYKLDQAFFSEAGINLNGVDPRNIKLYGNGGSMLPQANSEFREDDLVQNAISIVGEGDGSFDSGDYLVFYGEGPHGGSYNPVTYVYSHSLHLYSDTNYYFLTITDDPGLRMESINSLPETTFEVTATKSNRFYEKEVFSPAISGRYWLGEAFAFTIRERDFAFYLPDVDPNGKIRVRLRVAANARTSTPFRLESNGVLAGNLAVSGITPGDVAPKYRTRTQNFQISPATLDGDSLRLKVSYTPPSNNSNAWLDWIEVDYDQDSRKAVSRGRKITVTDNVEAGAVAHLDFGEFNNGFQVWDITNPLRPTNLDLANVSNGFGIAAPTIKHFISFNEGDMFSPVGVERVANQNLHGLDLADYLLISPEVFRVEAERLAQFHRDHYGRVVHVISPRAIYNEFSSGKQDVTAIRDFIKMFYDRSAGTLPGFVLLFGDGTYDYKGILSQTESIPSRGNFIPTYQSRDSWSPVTSYTSDDFFVILDENEGFWGEDAKISGDAFVPDDDRLTEVNFLDAAVGRLPVENLDQAKLIVDKIIDYATNPTGLGSWRNKVLLVADHREGEGAIHVSQADSYTRVIEESNPCINLEKIYMDNYPSESTPTALKFPKGKEALLNSLDEGSLIVNYTGHGGTNAWSHADILEENDFLNIDNPNKLPVFVTATCSFGHFDDPDDRSGAEKIIMMSENKGSIAMMTTVRLVYSTPNAALNANLYREVFKFDADKGRMPTLGEIMMRTKNATFTRGSTTNINSRNFTLLGDPGLLLNYPSLNARITSINDFPVGSPEADSLKSLGTIRIQGVIEDLQGNQVPDFNGQLTATVFDKPSTFTTRLSNFSFNWQTTRIFNGDVSVKNGAFDFSFVVPIDISYDDGFGKISMYLFGESEDGGGCYGRLVIGGTDISAPSDNKGPGIEVFLNDSLWKSGGITDASPLLLATLNDPSGINTVGSSIGHEIIGILDGDESNPIILNEFYRARKDSYTSGDVTFPFKNLEPGKHTLTVRAWDGANNPSEASTIFFVSESSGLEIGQIRSVPNPFTSEANFWIEHNQANAELQIELEIADLAGRLVKSFVNQGFATGNNFSGFTWDGKTEGGQPVVNGMYLCRVKINNLQTGEEETAFIKLLRNQ